MYDRCFPFSVGGYGNPEEQCLILSRGLECGGRAEVKTTFIRRD